MIIKEAMNACLLAGSSKATAEIKQDAIKKEIELILSKSINMNEEDKNRAMATIKRLKNKGRRFNLNNNFLNDIKQRAKKRRERQIAINNKLKEKSWLTE